MSKFLFYKPLLVIASLFISTNGTKFLFANKLTGNKCQIVKLSVTKLFF